MKTEPHEFTCEMCGKTFQRAWTEEVAMAEREVIWDHMPIPPKTDFVGLPVLCDLCWALL